MGRWSAMRRPLAAPGTANAVGVGPARSLSSLGSSAMGTSRRSLTGPQPSLVPKQIRELSACRWIAHGENVLLLGPPGVGKTHLALDHQQPHGLGVEDRLWRCRGRHRDPGSAAAPQGTRSAARPTGSRGGAAPGCCRNQTPGTSINRSQVRIGGSILNVAGDQFLVSPDTWCGLRVRGRKLFGQRRARCNHRQLHSEAATGAIALGDFHWLKDRKPPLALHVNYPTAKAGGLPSPGEPGRASGPVDGGPPYRSTV